MTVFTFPQDLPAAAIPASVTLRMMSAVALDTNQYTYSQIAYEWPGQMWGASFVYDPLEREVAEQLIATLLKCNLRAGSFRLGDPSGAAPRGVGTGTPLVNGANQTGNDLITDGWTISQTGILKAGDYIQLEDRLYKVLSDANSNGSGQATFQIWPSLRSSPADNAPLTVNSAKGKFRLTGDLDVSVDSAINYGISIEAIEAL